MPKADEGDDYVTGVGERAEEPGEDHSDHRPRTTDSRNLRCDFRGFRHELIAKHAERSGIGLGRFRIEEVGDVVAETLALGILAVPLQHRPLHERIEDVVVPAEGSVLLAVRPDFPTSHRTRCAVVHPGFVRGERFCVVLGGLFVDEIGDIAARRQRLRSAELLSDTLALHNQPIE